MWSNLMTSLLIEVMAMIRQLVYLQHQGRGCTIYHARSWHIPIMMFIFNWARTMQLIPMDMQIMGDMKPAQLMQSSRWRRVIEYSSNTGMYQNLKKSVDVSIQRFLDILCKNKKYFDIIVVFKPYYYTMVQTHKHNDIVEILQMLALNINQSIINTMFSDIYLCLLFWWFLV